MHGGANSSGPGPPNVPSNSPIRDAGTSARIQNRPNRQQKAQQLMGTTPTLYLINVESRETAHPQISKLDVRTGVKKVTQKVWLLYSQGQGPC